MEIARVTSRGQLTLPKEVRTNLSLNHGDTVFFRQSGQFIIMQKNKSNSPKNDYPATVTKTFQIILPKEIAQLLKIVKHKRFTDEIKNNNAKIVFICLDYLSDEYKIFNARNIEKIIVERFTR